MPIANRALTGRVLLLLLLYLSADTGADAGVAENYSGYRISEDVGGTIFSEDRHGDSQNMSIVVEIASDDSERQETILLVGAYKGGVLHFQAPYNANIQAGLEAAVSKAIEWTSVAKVNSIDVTRSLACFSADSGNSCDNAKSQINLKFRSDDQARKVFLDLQSSKVNHRIELDPVAMHSLLKNIKMIPNAFEKLRIIEKKQQELFR